MKSVTELQAEIKELLKDKNAILLAHNYQRDEVQEVSDVGGDSLLLSQTAADSDAEVIVFAGVHFMAESAAVLAPDKTVLLPREDAGCPMADMINAEDIYNERQKRPGVPIVAYVNTTAEVKAYSDICCTSANAANVVNSLEGDSVFMLPDRNLAQYTQRHTKKKIEWWDGFCPTHEWLSVDEIKKCKADNPGSIFVAHPECAPEILDLADHITSTSGMYAYAKECDAKTIIIGTEMGVMWRLQKENPDKKFIMPSDALICPNMKMITLEDIIDSLENMNGIIEIPEDIRIPAKEALDKMLAVPREN